MPAKKSRKKDKNLVEAFVMVLVVNIVDKPEDIPNNVLGFKLEDTEKPGDGHDTTEKIQRAKENLGTGSRT